MVQIIRRDRLLHLPYDNSSGDLGFGDYSTDSGSNDNSGSSGSSSDSGSSNSDNSSSDDGSTDGTTEWIWMVKWIMAPIHLVDDGVFNIGAAGDWASGTNAHETALSMYRKGVDLTLGLGDYAYSTGSSAVHAWWDNQMAPVHERFKGALGNHDTQDQSVYAQLFGQSDGLVLFF